MTKQEFLDKFGTLDFTIILADAISGTATAGQCLARYGITDHPQRTLKAMVKLGIMPESELCRFTARKAMSAEDQLMADFGTTDVLSILGPDVLEGRQSISNRLISLGVAPLLFLVGLKSTYQPKYIQDLHLCKAN